MRKRVLSFVLSAALIANPFLSVQTAKAETNTSAIPVQLVKKAESGGEERGDYNPSSKGKIESIDIMKPKSSAYLDKAYYQTELDGKAVKSLQWLDAEKGLIKYELANEPTLPQNVELYYKTGTGEGEQIAKANYYFTGGKADVSFTLSEEASNRVDVVNENGVALTNEEVYIAEDKNEEEYTFLVQTKEKMRETKITVDMVEKDIRTGSMVKEKSPLTSSQADGVSIDNLSTKDQITLKYKVKVKKGYKYEFTVNGVENTGTASFTLDRLECTRPSEADSDNWFYHEGASSPYIGSIKKYGRKIIKKSEQNEEANSENAILFSQQTLENGNIEATFQLNTYDSQWDQDFQDNVALNYLVDCIAIEEQFVQVPAPPMAYCHSNATDTVTTHWNGINNWLNSSDNKAVETKFTNGKLAGSTVEVKITSLNRPETGLSNAVGLVYTVTIKEPPKESIRINIRTRTMSQGYIAKASTRGIKNLELYCNDKNFWERFSESNGAAWQSWKAGKVDWISPLAKSIEGNIVLSTPPKCDMRGGETINQASITESTQKFKIRFQVEDGYVKPKVVYDHQELDTQNKKPYNMQYSSDSTDSSKRLEMKRSETPNKEKAYEIGELTVPRYGFEKETSTVDGAKVLVGNLSSLLFQVELLELPVELNEQNGADVIQVGTMNVLSRKTLQIPDKIPQKENSYFTGYQLYKVSETGKDPNPLNNGKYYYPGQTLTLEDVGQFAVNGEKTMDKVVLEAVYGEDTDTAGKVVVKTILKKLDDSTEVYDQKVFSAVTGSSIRVNNVVEKITKDSEFKFSEAYTTSMTKVETTNVTRAGDVTQNSGFSLDGKVSTAGQVFEIIYVEEEGPKLELFNAGTTDKVPNDTVVAGSEVKVNLTLKKIGDMPKTIQVKVPGTGTDEPVTLRPKEGSDNDEKVVYEADNILVTKAETGTVTISDEDKAKIQEVEKITNPPLTVVAGKPSSQTSTIKVSPSAIAITGSSIGTVELKDAYGNPIKDANPIVKVDGKDLPVDSVITNKGNGIYEFPYTPDSVGNKLFELMGDGNQRIGKDILTVESGAGTISITKNGQPVDKTPVHEEITITVTVKDNGLNPPGKIKVAVPGVDDKVILTKQPDGTYTGTATPKQPAAGKVTIEDEGYKNITPKPITVTAGKPDSTKSTITVSPSPALVGDKVTGKVELKDKYGNPVTGVIPEITVDGKVITIPDSGIKELENGQYVFTFTPDTVGEKTIGVSVDQEQVVGTTLKVEVGEVDNNNSTIVVNPNPAVVGENANGNLSLKDKNGNPITGKNPVISVDGTPVTNVKESSDGEYTFTYVPNKEGTSTITVVVDGKEGPKYTLQVVAPPNRGGVTIPFIENPTSNQGGTSTIPEKEEEPSKPSKPSIPTEKEDVSKPSKKPTTNKKDTVVEEKEKPKAPKKEDDNQGVKEFNRIPEKSSNDTNTVTNNIGKPIEYANWYYDTLDTKDNTFITTNGLEALEQLPKGTKIGQIQGVNYNKLGLQKGFVRVMLPDGTMKRVPVEVAVLSNAQVKLKGLRAGDIYVIGKTLGANETGKTQGKTQGSGLVQAIIPKTGERSMLSIFMMLLVSGVVMTFTFRRRKQNN